MLTVISGNLGSGKTLFLTVLGKISKRHIIANYNLEFEFEEFSMYEFVKGNYSNALILIDEAYSLLDSRNYMSSENQALSYVLFQSRKKTIDMVLTVQLTSSLDLRFRDMADVYIHAMGLVMKKGVVYYKYVIYPRGKSSRSIYLKYSKAIEYYRYYNTNQIIEPLRKDKLLADILQPKEKVKLITQFAIEINKEYEGFKITKGTVKYWLFKHEKPANLSELIYEELRQLRKREEVENAKEMNKYAGREKNFIKNKKK